MLFGCSSVFLVTHAIACGGTSIVKAFINVSNRPARKLSHSGKKHDLRISWGTAQPTICQSRHHRSDLAHLSSILPLFSAYAQQLCAPCTEQGPHPSTGGRLVHELCCLGIWPGRREQDKSSSNRTHIEYLSKFVSKNVTNKIMDAIYLQVMWSQARPSLKVCSPHPGPEHCLVLLIKYLRLSSSCSSLSFCVESNSIQVLPLCQGRLWAK